MTAREAKRMAKDALRYMADSRGREGGVHESFGYAWGTLARIAGEPGKPLPSATWKSPAVKP